MSSSLRKMLEQQERLARLTPPYSALIGVDAFPGLRLAEASAVTAAWEQPTAQHAAANALICQLERYHPFPFPPEPSERLRLAEMAVRTALDASGVSSAVRTITDSLWAIDRNDRGRFLLPAVGDMLNLASAYAVSNSHLRSDQHSWVEAVLANRMAAMTSPWMDINEGPASVRAFADIQLIGRFANSGEPYEESTSEFFRARLGDWREADSDEGDEPEEQDVRTARYASRGLDQNLTRFTPEAFDESLEIAGLLRTPTALEAVVFQDVGQEHVERNYAIYRSLLCFEMYVRQFIATVLERHFGSKWMSTQIPPKMLEQWHEKKCRGLQNGEPDRPLIQYADFNDYHAIFVKRDNWNQVFVNVFHRQQDIHETLHRLHPVRLQTMHARTLTLDEELLLRSETNRFYQATQRFHAHV